MTSGIYHVQMKARYLGQAIVQGFWYHSVLEGLDITDWALNGSAALAQAVKERIWDSVMQTQVPTAYSLDSINVSPYNDVAELVYQTPLEFSVNEVGTNSSAGGWLPPALTVNFKASMSPTVASNPLFRVPSKGLFTVSPVHESWVGEDGTLNEIGETVYEPFVDAFADKLDWPVVGGMDIPLLGWVNGIGIAGAFEPIRVNVFKLTTPEIIGGVTVFKHLTWAKVSSVILRKRTGYRRSRMVE